MENNSSTLERWKSFLLKNDYFVLSIVMAIFIVCLFIAIIYRIEGLGIFSIVLGIISIVLLMYYRNTPQNTRVRLPGPGSTIEKNASLFLNHVLDRNYLPLLIDFLFRIITNLIKNIEQLDPDSVKKIIKEIENFNNKLTNSIKNNEETPPKKTK